MRTIFAEYNPHRNSIDVCPLHDQSRTALAASFSIFIKPAMIPSTMLPTTARFVLTFPMSYAVGLGQKNTPLVSQRGIKDYNILI